MATQRIIDFLADRRPEWPRLVVDLDVRLDAQDVVGKIAPGRLLLATSRPRQPSRPVTRNGSASTRSPM